MTAYKDDLVDGLRAGMRRLVSGVCIISLKDGEGVPHAMTASSVTSLSNNPPALLVCVNKDASPYQALADKQPFCVNVLHEQHQELSAHCASKSEEGRFAKGNWDDHSNNLPFIVDAEASFFCSTDQVIEYGSHIIAIGRLTEVLTSDDDTSPLLYADGQYRTLT